MRLKSFALLLPYHFTFTVTHPSIFDIFFLIGYNRYMEIKDKIDLLTKRAELIYKKMFIFLAIAGGSWIYGLKDTEGITVRIAALIIFAMAAIGIILNLLKFGKIQNELKELADD